MFSSVMLGWTWLSEFCNRQQEGPGPRAASKGRIPGEGALVLSLTSARLAIRFRQKSGIIFGPFRTGFVSWGLGGREHYIY